MKTLERWLMSFSERTRLIIFVLVGIALAILVYHGLKWSLQSLGIVGWKASILWDCLFIYLLVREWITNRGRKLQQPKLLWHWLRLGFYAFAILLNSYNILDHFFG